MKTMFSTLKLFSGAAAIASLMAITACESKKTTEEIQKSPVELASDDLNAAIKQFEKDSTDFVNNAPDSTKAQEHLEKLKKMRYDYYSKKGFWSPSDDHCLQIESAIQQAQIKVDIATGQVLNRSRDNLRKAQEAYQAEANKARN